MHQKTDTRKLKPQQRLSVGPFDGLSYHVIRVLQTAGLARIRSLRLLTFTSVHGAGVALRNVILVSADVTLLTGGSLTRLTRISADALAEFSRDRLQELVKGAFTNGHH